MPRPTVRSPVLSPWFIRDTDTKIAKVKERNEAYYEKYPEDVDRVKNIMQYLTQNKVALPSGLLTPARFQQLGILLGFHGKTLDSDNQPMKANTA
jgi:hypothetical protein